MHSTFAKLNLLELQKEIIQFTPCLKNSITSCCHNSHPPHPLAKISGVIKDEIQIRYKQTDSLMGCTHVRRA